MYEVTGYENEAQRAEFWAKYEDFDKILGDINFVNPSLNEQLKAIV